MRPRPSTNLTVPEKKKRSSSGRRMLPKLHNCQRTGDRSMLTSERFKVIPFHSILTIFYLFSDAFFSAFIIPTITSLQYLIGKAGPEKEEAVM